MYRFQGGGVAALAAWGRFQHPGQGWHHRFNARCIVPTVFPIVEFLLQQPRVDLSRRFVLNAKRPCPCCPQVPQLPEHLDVPHVYKRGIDLNLQDQNGCTALIFSLMHGNLQVANALLSDSSVLVNLTDIRNHDALMYACNLDMRHRDNFVGECRLSGRY